MRVYQINTIGNLSTGKVAVDLYKTIVAHGGTSRIAFARNTIPDGIDHYKIGTKLEIYIHGLLSRLTDRTGFFSSSATKKVIRDIEQFTPDIVHLHNIHGYYINVEMLLGYLRDKRLPIVMTIHDCWTFTGHCAYFDYVGCEKWKDGCHHCVQKKGYPSSLVVDNSKGNWLRKKACFTDLNLTIVTPSEWLKKLVAQSFLKDYPCVCIPNGIDLELYKPTQSDFKKKYHIEDKKIILGVAGIWSDRKGLKDFIKLAEKLTENKEYCILLVGVPPSLQKDLPVNIIAIERTDHVQQLIEIYSAAHVFLNLTYEDNFPMTNLEALACGTPVITYRTGGSVESVDESVGAVVEQGDVDAVLEIVEMFSYVEDSEVYKNHAKKFDCHKTYGEYLERYEEIIV